MNYIFSFENVPDEKIRLTGGKGASLIKLNKAGLNVPGGYIITVDAFDSTELRSEAADELSELLDKLSSKYTYAVRSSALNEDGENASFAGVYETITNVKKSDIIAAVNSVARSAEEIRVKRYASEMYSTENGIAVVIQRFVKAEFAGVLFTSDIITGSSAKMQGNYVHGCGESLVSGNADANEFSFNAMKYSYNGSDEFKHYAHKLYKSAVRICKQYSRGMDIEWAVAQGSLYILQARPITTLRRIDMTSYEINGSLSGDYLFSKTNVGEIFMSTVSPMTFSMLESICDLIGVPCFLDNICGQAYCNLSVVCSALMSFGFSKEKAFSIIGDIAGKIHDGVEVPVFPFDKKNFLRKIRKLVFSEKRKSSIKMSKEEFTERIPELADEIIERLRQIDNNEDLLDYWQNTCCDFMPKIFNTISSLFPVMKPFLGTSKKLSVIAGEELAAELCAGSMGVLESMKPLMMLEDVINGKITREEYIKECGHRSVSEMELSEPYPYESEDFPKNLIEEHKKSGINIHKMQQEQQKVFEEAVEKFKALYPQKSDWLDRTLSDFRNANKIRESIRSKAVRLFCIIREYLLKAAQINNLGNDVFMLYFNEVQELLKGDRSVLENISARRENFEKYRTYPAFPNVIMGRFEPDKWLMNDNRRLDFYSSYTTPDLNSDIKGFAGATGIVTGRVRVITDISEANTLQSGEILVTTATNIGWTVIFPKAAAIVTDIGAPLSHAAIVAREFGIPAVVGCGNATTLLHTGELICVNGSHGTVEIISSE